MKAFKTLLLIAFILVSMLLGFWLYSDNSEPVALVLFGFSLPQQPLGLWIVATFACGILLGLLVNVVAMSFLMMKVHRLQKQVDTKKQGGG